MKRICLSAFLSIGMLIMALANLVRADVEDSRFTLLHDKDHPVEFSPAYSDRAAWEKRAQFLRTQFLVAEGLWPMPEKCPLDPVVTGKIDCGDYTIENVYFRSMPGHYITGSLYRPKGRSGKLPAVLSPHGHSVYGRFVWHTPYQVKAMIDRGEERSEAGAITPTQARCAMLAQMGCIVFVYDMVGMGDSQKISHWHSFEDAEALLRLQSEMGLQTWNSIRALDFLDSLPDVDPQRIAVCGESGGGTQTITLTVVDPRPCAAFPAVMVSENMQGGCICENAPLARVSTNNAELISMFAPKPLGMSAANDWTHDLVTRGFPQIKSIYALFGAADEVEAQHFPFPHGFNQPSREMMYEFMNRALHLGMTSPISEKPFAPQKMKDISVFNDQHPVPADALDERGVREQMTKASDEQLTKLRAKPEEYRAMLHAALQAMVVDAMPSPEQVEMIGPDFSPASGGTWKGLLGRRDSGERVPCQVIAPQNWNGDVVIWAHRDGIASVSKNGQSPPVVQKLLNSGSAVLAIDIFMSGDFEAAAAPKPIGKESTKPTTAPYAGLRLGYQRSVIANRTHDLLSAIALARGWKQTRSVRLIGLGRAGPSALLADALAGDEISAAAVDLDGFDFDQVHDVDDPMLLPGAIKYGGLGSFSELCAGRPTLLCSASPSTLEADRKSPAITVESRLRDAAELLDWLETHPTAAPSAINLPGRAN